MKKYIFMLTLCVFVFSSCRTTSSGVAASPQDAGGFWDTAPVSGELIFHGAAGVRFDRDASIRLALEDAARKAAMFTQVGGRIVFYGKTGVNFWDYQVDTENSLFIDQDYEKYIEHFTFDSERDVLQEYNTIFVRVRYPSPVPVNIPRLQSSHGGARPGWIGEPPRIPGYVTGIGYAGRRISYGDTVKDSYENAVFSIIRNISSTVTGNTADVQGSGGPASNESRIAAGAMLKEFYVLDFWVDPVNQTVWTLAIAKPDT
ncbi:MAG: hypothetical protein LBQ14_04920 [Treponema sp.]|nr:hypothetical protein [Treponema sp.]